MSGQRDVYIKEMFALARVNFDQWRRFIEAYRWYSMEQIELMLSAPSGELHVAVGRARQMLLFLDEIQNVEDTYKKIMDKQNK